MTCHASCMYVSRCECVGVCSAILNTPMYYAAVIYPTRCLPCVYVCMTIFISYKEKESGSTYSVTQ